MSCVVVICRCVSVGADVITSLSTRSLLTGISLCDISLTSSVTNMSVELAVETRDEWWAINSHHQYRQKPLVAAFIDYVVHDERRQAPASKQPTQLVNTHQPRSTQRAAILVDGQQYHGVKQQPAKGRVPSLLTPLLLFTLFNRLRNM